MVGKFVTIAQNQSSSWHLLWSEKNNVIYNGWKSIATYANKENEKTYRGRFSESKNDTEMDFQVSLLYWAAYCFTIVSSASRNIPH